MLRTALPLKYVLLLVGLGMTLATMLLSAWYVERATSNVIVNQIGRTLAVLAHEIEDKIEIKLHERYEDLSRSGALTVADSAPSAGAAQAVAERVLNSSPGFRWVGIYSSDATSIASTGQQDLFESLDPSTLVSMILARREPETPAFRLVPPKPGGKWNIEVAAGVRDRAGELKAVLAAIVDVDWIPAVLLLSKEGEFADAQTQIAVMASDGRVITGLADQPLANPDILEILKTEPGSNGTTAATGADGQTYVTGYVRSEAGRFVGNYGLIILVKQRAIRAHAALWDMRRNILIALSFIAANAIVFHWGLAALISSPILKLANAADSIRKRKDTAIPKLMQYAEVAMLSESLTLLVDELRLREAKLSALAESLELQVRERTLTLSEKNKLLEHANRTAEEAVEAKSRVLAAASHDLRQPLHALSLYCHALKRRVTSPEMLQLTFKLEQSLSSLNSMLDALLHIARLDAGLVSRSMVPVRLNELIDLVGAEFAVEADERGLKFNSLSMSLSVLTDPALFETIVRNLLSNAFKFTRSGGVFLGARSRGSTVVVEVYDTGPGIPPERLATIFQEFERSEQHALGSNTGLGLGLSIVERSAKLIGAEISVCSQVGQGSRFSLTLPKVPFDERVPTASPAQVNHAPISDRKILLIDDNVSALDALHVVLTDKGANVRSFIRVAEAWNALREQFKPDIAIVDFDLGHEQTGVDCVQMFRRSGFHFPVIILTGRTDSHSLEIILKSDLAWMTKPADPSILAHTIARMVDTRLDLPAQNT